MSRQPARPASAPRRHWRATSYTLVGVAAAALALVVAPVATPLSSAEVDGAIQHISTTAAAPADTSAPDAAGE